MPPHRSTVRGAPKTRRTKRAVNEVRNAIPNIIEPKRKPSVVQKYKKTIAMSMLASSVVAVLMTLAARRGIKLTPQTEVPVEVVHEASKLAAAVPASKIAAALPASKIAAALPASKIAAALPASKIAAALPASKTAAALPASQAMLALPASQAMLALPASQGMLALPASKAAQPATVGRSFEQMVQELADAYELSVSEKWQWSARTIRSIFGW
jgi:hypothetical protein